LKTTYPTLTKKFKEGWYKFVVLDALRWVEVQCSLFDTFKERLKKENPAKSDREITEIALKFVVLPSYDNKNLLLTVLVVQLI